MSCGHPGCSQRGVLSAVSAVAMEMKEDFLKPPERIFHKIYIQRHDNVRYKEAGGAAS